jgi:hypothetical protein
MATNSDLWGVETALQSSIPQPPIACEEDVTLRIMLAPLHTRGQLQSAGRSQVLAIHKTHGASA